MRSLIKNVLNRVWKKKFIIPGAILLTVVIGVGTYVYVKNSSAKAAGSTVEYQVRRRNIDVLVSGSGPVKSDLRQDISPKVAGTVHGVYFKQGDKVKAKDVLFQLDDSDAQLKVEKTRQSIRQKQSDLDNVYKNKSYLNVTSPIAGQVSNIMINQGDSVNKGAELFTVTDTKNLKLLVPFNQSQIGNLYVGQKAEVSLQDYMDVVEGTVSYISNSGKIVDGGGRVYNVEVTLVNPGSIKAGAKAAAKIGDEMSVDTGTLQYNDVKKVRAQVNGTINSINVREDQYLYDGQVAVNMENEDLDDQISNAKVSLEDLNIQLESDLKNLDKYKVYALQDGTIVKQDVKVGDEVKGGDVMSTISNPDALGFEIAVDELDISKIELGMEATVTIDALTGKRFKGLVSKIDSEGTSQNGVTTYPITVSILDPIDIKEGMNANADITVQHKEDVLTLPISAVQKFGQRSMVFVKGVDGQSQQANPEGSSRRNGNQNGNGQGQGNSRMQSMLKELGPGVSIRMVETGINNDNDIEILSGLNEGDRVIVAVPKTTNNQRTQQQVMPFGGGGGFGGNFGGGNRQNGGNNGQRDGQSSQSSSQSGRSGGSSGRNN